jgi:hypothetical protein
MSFLSRRFDLLPKLAPSQSPRRERDLKRGLIDDFAHLETPLPALVCLKDRMRGQRAADIGWRAFGTAPVWSRAVMATAVVGRQRGTDGG